MSKNIIKFMKKQWLAVWLIVVVLGFASLVAYAEYTSQNSYMGRVVVSKDGTGMLFSSNLLKTLTEVEGEMKSSYQPVYKAPKANGTYDVDVLLWNYNEQDETNRYDRNINYRVEAVLTDSSGNALSAADLGSQTITIVSNQTDVTMIVLSKTHLSDTISPQTLVHSDSSSTENSYTVKFSSGWDLENDIDICVELRAVPTVDDSNNAYSDLSTLGRIIGIRQSRITGTNGWKASLNEKTESNSPTGFDAYNLVFTGSGSATITVSWDVSKIAVNKNFYAPTNNVFGFVSGEVVDGGTTDGWHTVTINADTGSTIQSNRNRYSLQLYKLGELDDSTYPQGWNFYSLNESAEDSPNAWIRVSIQ